ncbi:MAG TPA: class III lanthionine synthetase LanKC [Longimicrobium sp.]|nr:class III lanthionine synthetase LanKC [Longimicrobium sp.]
MSNDAFFSLFDREFFRSPDERSPGTELADRVAVLGDEGWWRQVDGVWTYLQPPGWSGLQQGWKLHVSATLANAEPVLDQVLSVLRADPAAFKLASDRTMLSLMLGKNWPREGSGKFITIYPASDEQFQRLARSLAAATEGEDGPYILSDRRVPGSRVVFYRYGQHAASEAVDVTGQRRLEIRAPTGEGVSDHRRGYYRHPEWVDDPYGSRPVRVVNIDAPKVTLNGRFQVEGALRYSNAGGIYRARDLETGETVVIREARPNVGWVDHETDAVALLQKEARVLQRMEGTGLAPRYAQLFQAWEHHFLAQEQVEGMVLRDHVLSRYFRQRAVASPRRLFWRFRRLIAGLTRGIEAFHARGIVLRDVSSSNVLVRRDGSLCFIDFEFCWQQETAEAVARIHTPGFGSPAQMAGEAPTPADDFYALGAIIVEFCSLMANGLALNADGVIATAEMMADEVGLPRGLLAIARGLLDPDPASRWRGDDVRRALDAIPASAIPWRPALPGRSPRGRVPVERDRAVAREAASACEAVCDFFDASATPEGKCLWPATPAAYRVNPVCIRFGACGPLELVMRVRGGCPDAWLDWVEQRSDPAQIPPGLYVGLAGVALTLARCGREEAGRRLLLAALDSPLLEVEPDLSLGSAGVGLAALVLGTSLEDQRLLEAAVRIATRLERRAEPRRRGIAWRCDDGELRSGFSSGAAGISLFYTYLGAWSGERRWWEVARQALEWEFSQVKHTAGFAFWPSIGGRRRKDSQSPHHTYGSAGIGAAAARLYACTGEEALGEWVDQCVDVATFRWTNKLWQDFGYAGLGELLLDAQAAGRGAAAGAHAARVAEVLLANRVRTRFGTAFPGGGLDRVASDFGMGASGIALFLERFAARRAERTFFADHLLPAWGPALPVLSLPGRAALTPEPVLEERFGAQEVTDLAGCQAEDAAELLAHH